MPLLDASERRRLKALVGRQRRGVMTAADETEFRDLIAKEFPADAQTLPLEGLVQVGLGMMAVWYLFPEDYPETPVAG